LLMELSFLLEITIRNPISSSMVGKYDGPNDDPARISCIPHRWF
jgi:hypothetical protein